jgi:DNA-binding GntR family transcriptional regulator
MTTSVTDQSIETTAGAADVDDDAAPALSGVKGGYNLSQLAYRSVSESIHSRRLKGGEVIVEAKLSEVLGISRTPLREALQRLEGEGLVVKVANRSFMVRNVDFTEYFQSLKVREILEADAAVLAIGKVPLTLIQRAKQELHEMLHATTYHTDAHWRSDDTVHEIYATRCGNPVMAGIIKSLRVTTRLFEVSSLKERLVPDSEEHLEILDSLEAGEPKRVKKAVQTHLRSLQKFALDSVSQ